MQQDGPSWSQHKQRSTLLGLSARDPRGSAFGQHHPLRRFGLWASASRRERRSTLPSALPETPMKSIQRTQRQLAKRNRLYVARARGRDIYTFAMVSPERTSGSDPTRSSNTTGLDLVVPHVKNERFPSHLSSTPYLWTARA